MPPQSTPSRQQFVRLCDCGCGQPTLLAPSSVARDGWVRGQPLRFLRSHNRPKTGPQYRVDPVTGCWIWERSRTHGGYGHLGVGGKTRRAHQVFYEREYGPVPPGMELDHICRNHACVRPSHLEPVTHAVNMQRGIRTKLTRAQVEEIRALAASGVAQRALARRFGVRHGQIQHILAGRQWR
jgi:hypothetical protein